MKKKRDKTQDNATMRYDTGCGKIYISRVGSGRYLASLGKSGVCAQTFIESTTRLINLALHAGVPAEKISKHLKGLQCHRSGGKLSCPEALSKALMEEE